MEAMTSLDISDNRLCGLLLDGSGSYDGAGVGALSEMLKANSSLRELNMSKNYLGPEGAKVMSVGLSDNGALSKLDLSRNHILATEAGMLNAACKAKGIDLAL
jgi:hypothetical protein